MNSTIITTRISNVPVGYQFAADHDTVELTSTGSISASFAGIESFYANNDVTVNGAINGGSSFGVRMVGDASTVYIGYSGTVETTGYPGVAVVMVGGFETFFNYGAVTSDIYGAAQIRGTACYALNVGVISGLGWGLWMSGLAASLDNYGTISATNSNTFPQGAVMVDFADAKVANHGTILGADGNDALMAMSPMTATGGWIHNSGTIESDGGTALNLRGLEPGSDMAVDNTGTISGTVTAILFNDGDNHLTNSGTVIGDIRLLGGNDVFAGIGGTVTGVIYGGAGNDIYQVSDSTVRIVELAGEGFDQIQSTVSFDLTGISGIEKLSLLGYDAINATGNDARNILWGNGGDNVVSGQGGNDLIVGLSGNDQLLGGAGDDVLIGGLGRDTLVGGDGDDRLTGGINTDLMTGGSGADVFIYTDRHQSNAGVHADTITDFTSGLDRISLAAIDADPLTAGDQAFAFIGAAAFGHVAGQVRYDAGLLEVDVDGNGVADMQIILAGAPVLVANDLSL